MVWESVPESFGNRLRVAIMGELCGGAQESGGVRGSGVASGGERDFVSLREATGASDGNLSTQLRRLEEAGYLHAEKRFVGRLPRTSYRATAAGIAAYRAYVTLLVSAIVGGTEKNRE